MSKYMFIVPSLSKGGAERVVSVLASGLAEQGKDEVVIVRYFMTDLDYAVSSKVKIITLSNGFEEDYNKLNRIKMLKMLRHIIKTEKPDHILPFLRHVNLQTYIAAFGKYRKKVVFTIRSSPYENEGKMGKIHNFLIEHKNMTIVQTQSQKEYFPKKSHKRIHVLPNPVKEEFIYNQTSSPREPFVVVGSGRLDKQKNFSMLINAFHNFALDKQNVRLCIYGEGNDEQKLMKQIKQLGCEDKIFLMGRTNDLVSVYKNASMFVLSSNFEGLPNALMEAMAIGLPCVSTDCKTGPADLIENEKTGILIPIDNQEEMSKAIDKIYNDEIFSKQIAENGRNFIINNFTLDIVLNRLKEIFNEI